MADINLTSLPTTTTTASGRVVGFEASGYRVYNLNEYARLASNLTFSGTTVSFQGDVDVIGNLTNDGDTVLNESNTVTIGGQSLLGSGNIVLPSGANFVTLTGDQTIGGDKTFSGTTITFQGDVDIVGNITNDGDTVLTSTNSATVSGDNLSAQRDVFLQRYAPSFTTSRSLTTQDFYKKIECTNTVSSNLRINPNIANLKGVTIKIDRLGSGEVSVSTQPGVTLLSLDGSTFLAGQYATATLEYKGQNTWLLTGDLA